MPLNGSLDSVMQPIEKARGLPNRHYTDALAFNEERHALLESGWVSIGFGKDVPTPGDVYPVDAFGLPMVLVRDRNGDVGVFHNVCRHRGMRLVDEPAHLNGVIRCRYHSWCYGLDGSLRTTPSIGGSGINTVEGFDKKSYGLKRVRSHVWMDVVFIDVTGTAPAFETDIASLVDRWAPATGRPVYHGGEDSGFHLDVNCNWKLAVENYCESYHLPWVHPGLNAYSRLEDHYDIRSGEGQAFSGQGSVVYSPILSESGQQFPTMQGYDPKWETGAEYIALYPNTLLGLHKDHYFAIVLQPLDVASTRERVELYYFDPVACGDDYVGLRDRNARLWRQVFEEDIFAVEGMQRGRASPGFDGGVFSPVMDGPTHDFHFWVAGRLQAAEQLSVQAAE